MFFFASKAFGWLVYPLSAALFFLLLAYLAVLLRRRGLFHVCFWIGAAILYLCSTEPVADALLRPLERGHAPVKLAGLKADAIVVLGGDLRPPGRPRTDIEVQGNRILKAVRLYRSKVAPVLVVTGGSGDLFHQGFRESVHMKKLAAELGVPASRIFVEARSRNTRENLLYTKEILDKLKAKKIVLVSHAFHLPRAQAVARKLGIDSIPVASDYLSADRGYDPLSWIPYFDNLVRSSVALKEYAGLVAYWYVGWI
jgi:uncharacterized SAM-binding protein YcdF (DUF218 family)